MQSTVVVNVSCEPSRLDEVLNLIREDLKDVKLIRGVFVDVESQLSLKQQQQNNQSINHISMNLLWRPTSKALGRQKYNENTIAASKRILYLQRRPGSCPRIIPETF